MKDDGGPAFPVDEDFRDDGITRTRRRGGMSLRDYFAAKALIGMHARDTFDVGLATPQQRASIAYRDADAMLAERAKGR